MNNKLPLSSKLCPQTIEDFVMTDKLVKILQDPTVPQELKDIAKMGLDLAMQAHSESNPTSN